MTRQEFYDGLTDYFCRCHPERQIDKITDTENLFDAGYIDSLTVVDLILTIQDMLDIEVTIGNHTVGSFHNMRRIYDTFACQGTGVGS